MPLKSHLHVPEPTVKNLMTPTPAKTPVLVGVAQIQQHQDNLAHCEEPLALMIRAVKAAAEDAEAPHLLKALDQVCVNQGVWSYSDPARAVASAVGAHRAQSARTWWGGNFVQFALNQMALAITRGKLEAVAFTGAEWGRSLSRFARAGREPEYMRVTGEPDIAYGQHQYMAHLIERKIGFVHPIQTYSLLENALRYQRGESIDAHMTRISTLWARFARIAADNPHAWIRSAPTAEAIRTPSATNRRVSFPYLKLLNSNNNVDQAAALILCSAEFARSMKIPESKWVYPLAGSDANDALFVSSRQDLCASPAIRLAGHRCLELAGLAADDLELVDLYSCFPVAVQIAARELGLDETRDLTLTGGLTFHGGPLNNYVMHSVARSVELLREAPHQRALCTANGGSLAKHSFTVYSGEPGKHPFRHENLQAAVDALPRREVLESWDGRLAVEGYTVMYSGNGEPETGFVTCLTPEGQRVLGKTSDHQELEAMLDGEFCGQEIRWRGHEFASV